MKLHWFKYAQDAQEREELKALLVSNKKLLGVLYRLIDEQIEVSEKNFISWKRYFMPRWSEYQADQIGFKRALKLVQTLIKEND